MLTVVLSVSVVLANSFAGQLLRGENIDTGIAVESDSATVDADQPARDRTEAA